MSETPQNGQKSFLVTVLLAFFVGNLGIHRFYTGYIGIGVAQLFTLGGCGLWTLIDLISICLDSYKDSQGRELEGYNKTVGTVIISLLVLFTILGVMANLGS